MKYRFTRDLNLSVREDDETHLFPAGTEVEFDVCLKTKDGHMIPFCAERDFWDSMIGTLLEEVK